MERHLVSSHGWSRTQLQIPDLPAHNLPSSLDATIEDH